MNQTFDLRRFGLVLKLHLSEHIRTYLMGIGVLFGILIIMLAPSTVKTKHFDESLYRFHGTMFRIIFCGAGAWFASEAFRIVSTPIQGIPYLTLPASRLEKYLVALSMMVLFIVVYSTVFYTIEGICISIINARLPQNEPRYQLLDLSASESYIPFTLRYGSVIVLPFFFVGSIYFSKVPFVKTSIIAFLVLFVAIFLNEYIVDQLFPDRDYYPTLFQSVHFQQSGMWYDVELLGTPKLVVNGTLLLMVLALWIVAYIRFKEKEL